MAHVSQIACLMSAIDALYHEAAYKLGQTDSAMTVLYVALDAGGRCELADICRSSGMRKQTLNSALRKLEEEGLVELTSGAGRGKALELTEAGIAEAQQTAGRLRQLEEAALSSWTQDEMDAYFALTQRFRDSFRAQVGALQ